MLLLLVLVLLILFVLVLPLPLLFQFFVASFAMLHNLGLKHMIGCACGGELCRVLEVWCLELVKHEPASGAGEPRFCQQKTFEYVGQNRAFRVCIHVWFSEAQKAKPRRRRPPQLPLSIALTL